MLFCGINPGLVSAATGYHFARPGNRFWPVLHDAGFTPALLRPDGQAVLPSLGLGLTNLVARASARAEELGRAELVAGAERLRELTERLAPRWLAMVGVTAYRTAFRRPRATFGLQPDRIDDTRIWVLPNPSGLNARWTRAALVEEYTRLRLEAEPGR